MPFISKDWRSPGELWVKNGSGWEKYKVIRFVSGSNENGPGQEAEPIQISNQQQPHCRINLRQTREISACNTLSEALQLLDFQNALRDQRKFTYICVIIRLLISNPLLGGNSQRQLIKLLFQMCDQVKLGWRYDLLRIIIQELRKSLDNFWGGNLGSAQLLNENKLHIDKIEALMESYSLEAPKIPIQDFPEEVIRLIIQKLSNDKDLKSLAEAEKFLKFLLSENRIIWKKLCIYHFSRENIITTVLKLQNNNDDSNKSFSQNFKSVDYSNSSITNTNVSDGGSNNNDKDTPESVKEIIDWENIYRHLKRNHNLKEEYAESLNYCKPCNILFWPSFGHPCRSESIFLDKDDKDSSNFLFEVTPTDFISFFST